MKKEHMKYLHFLIFTFLALLFFINLNKLITNDNTCILIINWFSVVGLFVILLYQIFSKEIDKKWILIEIFIVSVLLHLVFQIGYFGLRGSDSFYDFDYLSFILTHFNLPAPKIISNDAVSGWPFIHILFTELIQITGIDALSMAKYFPSILSSLIIFPIYSLSYKVYKNESTSLIAVLIFITIPQFVSFEALFVREVYGLLMCLFLFYIVYVYNKNRDYRFALLLMILIPATVLGHSFTPFLFLLLILIYMMVITIYQQKENHYKSKLNKIVSNSNLRTVVTLLTVSMVSYWVYESIAMLRGFVNVFLQISGVKEITTYAEKMDLSSPIASLRGIFLFYGFFIFNGIFTLIMVKKLFIKTNKFKVEDITFTAFFILCGIYGLSSMFLLKLPYPDRFLSHAWIFGSIVLTSYYLFIKQEKYKRMFISLLFLFMIFNVYNIPSDYLSGNYAVIEGITTEKDYLIANTIEFNNYKFAGLYGYSGVNLAIFDKQNLRLSRMNNINDLENLSYNSSKIAIINENIVLNNLEGYKIKSPKKYERINTLLAYEADKGVIKISDSGNGVYILKGIS